MNDEAAALGSPPVNRMIIAVLALIGVLISVYLTLHKYGIVGTLVCGAGSCETVQASPWAVFMGVPVPVLGLAGYLLLLAVALAGLQPERVAGRIMPILLLLLANTALVFTLYLTYLEAFVIHAWCRWCIVSAVLVTLIWLAALAELPKLRRAP
ncbi:MAG: vitamin K epoxide reductase family protein [Gemmatimonadota bacterium]